MTKTCYLLNVLNNIIIIEKNLVINYCKTYVLVVKKILKIDNLT